MKIFCVVLCAFLIQSSLARPYNELTGTATAVAQATAESSAQTGNVGGYGTYQAIVPNAIGATGVVTGSFGDVGSSAAAQSYAQSSAGVPVGAPAFYPQQQIYQNPGAASAGPLIHQIAQSSAVQFAQNQAFQQAVHQNIIDTSNQINIAHANAVANAQASAVANAQAAAVANAQASASANAVDTLGSRFSQGSLPGNVEYTVTSVNSSPASGVVTQTQTFSGGSVTSNTFTSPNGESVTTFTQSGDLGNKFAPGQAQFASTDGHSVTYVSGTTNDHLHDTAQIIASAVHDGGHSATEERFTASETVAQSNAINPADQIDIRFSQSSSNTQSAVSQNNGNAPQFTSSSVSSSVSSVNGETHGNIVSSQVNEKGEVHSQNVVISPAAHHTVV